MKKTLIILVALLFLLSCSAQTTADSPLVLKFGDFGPAAMSEPFLGQSWWQWQDHADSRPKEYDIKVVIYKSGNLDDIKNLYPVSQENLNDYRYVTYARSLDYLNKHIEANVIPQTTEKLKGTKQKVLEHFEES